LRADRFRQILDDNPKIMHVELSNWGEMFLNPQLPEILEEAYRRGVILTVSNGVNLNTARTETLEALVKFRFAHLVCAIDGATQETYEAYRRNGALENVINNIKTINGFKKKYRSRFPMLTWQFIDFRHNKHEIDQARQMAESLGMEFFIKPDWGDFDRAADGERRNRSQKPEPAPAKDQPIIRDADSIPPAASSDKEICSQLWVLPQINWDGRVLGCCANYWGDYGNAFQEPLAAIMDGEKLRYARAMVRGTAGPRADIPCTSCHFYKAMQAKDDWMTAADLKRYRNIFGIPYWARRLGVRIAMRFPFVLNRFARRRPFTER
jgi:MoaA/NifB/PqqE/SkfB family radical SAM enzyme